MRRTFALWFVTSLLACGCAAGLAAPAALASAVTGTTTQPSFNLNNAGASSALQTTTTPISSGTTTTSSSGGISTTDGVIIAIVAGLLLIGIAVGVRRDAHKHLAHIRHGDREDAMFATAHSGSKAPRKSRKLTPAERKRRKRGKAR
jgi:hypothetical protein